MERLPLFACGLLVLNYVSVCSSATPCTQMSACTANCDGKIIDVSSIYKAVNNISNGVFDYVFACTNQTCNQSENVAVCQKETSNDEQWSLGAANASVWELITKIPLHFTISYNDGYSKDGYHRHTLVIFVENDNSSTPLGTFIQEDRHTATYMFIFTASSKYFSSGHSSNTGEANTGVTPGIIGIGIIILFLVAIVAYFVIGSSIMYFHKGARGKEIIPNYELWLDLPFLLKDGCLFFICPCYNRSTYKKIKTILI